jgi:uncharacterized membrane protein AbrB (regulator of aidB expression)
MSQVIRALAVLLAANFEAIIFIYCGWRIGVYLNEQYASETVNWIPISLIVALVCIVYSWIILLRPVIKNMGKKDD